MTRYFLDTSALVKIYHREKGTDQALHIYRDGLAHIFISELTIIEFRSTVYRKLREKELTEEALVAVLNLFDHDSRNRYEVLPLGSAVIEKSCELFSKHGDKFGLRTLDSIQYASFLTYCNLDSDYFLCSDTKFINILSHDNVKTVSI